MTMIPQNQSGVQLLKIGNRFINPAHIVSIAHCQKSTGYKENSTAQTFASALAVDLIGNEYEWVIKIDTPEGQSLLRYAESLATPEPPPTPDPCAEELARQIGVMTEQNAKLYREKSDLLDLLTRAYLNRHRIDDALNEAMRDALTKAGRL